MHSSGTDTHTTDIMCSLLSLTLAFPATRMFLNMILINTKKFLRLSSVLTIAMDIKHSYISYRRLVALEKVDIQLRSKTIIM